MDVDILNGADINYIGAVKRFMGNNKLYEELLLEFLEDSTFNDAVKAYQNKNYESLFTHFHTLKGVTGNLNLSALYNALCRAVDLLRRGDYSKVDEDFLTVSGEYNRVVAAIKLANNH